MNELMNLFYPPFNPPKTRGRVHKIGFDGPRYIPPAPVKPRTSQGPSNTQVMFLKMLKKVNRPIDSIELSGMVGMTRNHCGIILTKLFRLGLLKRVKCVNGSVRFYQYWLKQPEDAS